MVGVSNSRVGTDVSLQAAARNRHAIRNGTRYFMMNAGMDLSDAKRLKQLEDENAKLKRLLADAMLDNVVLKDLLGKP